MIYLCSVVRLMKVPLSIYRLRPLNSTFVVVLDSSFKLLQIWDMEGGTLVAEQKLERPAKEIVVEGNIVYTLGRFEARIDAFNISNNLKPANSPLPIRLSHQHCQSLARAGEQKIRSLLVACPSGILQISVQNGQILRTFNELNNTKETNPTTSISALQMLTGPDGNAIVLAASRMRREMLMFNLDGKLKARLRIKQEKQANEKRLWLWTALAMYDDKIYAMDYIGNKVEVFNFQKLDKNV
uniref:WD_REPEATS_REGION domain-containing protein n=1 Tax=Meloidogyne hapla TaxID=6305 RepID=A0A1I8C0K8_MELHA